MIHRYRMWLTLRVLLLLALSPAWVRAQWPNEPTGATVISDYGFSDTFGVGQGVPMGSSGWENNNNQGYCTRSSDATAPLSPSFVLEQRYPIGFSAGVAPCTAYYYAPANYTEGYMGFWWKPSNPWQSESDSNVNKIFFLSGTPGHIIPVIYGGAGGPYELRIAPSGIPDPGWQWMTPNVTPGIISLGVWHQIEIYFKQQTSGGIIRWWMDGVMVGNYTNVSFPVGQTFDFFAISPTWGGVSNTKTQEDFFWFDHIHVSQGGSYGPDTTPPTVTGVSPTNAATGVSVNTLVTATFNEPMDASTITTSTVELRTPGNTVVPASVSYNASTRTATLTPSSALATSTTYTGRVISGASGVKDVAGNALATTYTWTFTTSASATSATLGYTTQGGTTDSNDANYMSGIRITVGPAPVSVVSLHANVGSISGAPNNQFQMAIYTDNGGTPAGGTLVVNSGSGTLTANAWNILPVTATLNANTSYWLMYNTNGSSASVNNLRFDNGAGYTGGFAAQTFGTWPTTFPAATINATTFSMYATVTIAEPPPPLAPCRSVRSRSEKIL